jgi:hypothetical protein
MGRRGKLGVDIKSRRVELSCYNKGVRRGVHLATLSISELCEVRSKKCIILSGEEWVGVEI